MIIALPAKDHDHLADALVRDLGFTRTHVDQPLRDLLLALDPFVDSGVTLANMGPTPRLSSKLEQVGGSWEKLLNPPRPGASPDRTATEVRRLLEVLRSHDLIEDRPFEGDVVVMGGLNPVAIRDRFDGPAIQYFEPAGVVAEQQAIVAYVQEQRTAPAPVGQRIATAISSELGITFDASDASDVQWDDSVSVTNGTFTMLGVDDDGNPVTALAPDATVEKPPA